MNKEHAPQSAEQTRSPESIDHQEQLERIRERLEQGTEKAPSAEKNQETIEAARHQAERAAASKDEILASLKSESTNPQNTFSPIDRGATFKNTMERVRAQLSGPSKKFSRFIHQPVVEKVSDGASKTIGRPSVLVGGFAFTFIGSTVIYTIMQHNGYALTSLSFMLLLFAVGAFSGLAIEFVYHWLRRRR